MCLLEKVSLGGILEKEKVRGVSSLALLPSQHWSSQYQASGGSSVPPVLCSIKQRSKVLRSATDLLVVNLLSKESGKGLASMLSHTKANGL